MSHQTEDVVSQHHFSIASGSKTGLDDSEWEWNSVASPIESSFDLSKTKDSLVSIETITSQGSRAVQSTESVNEASWLPYTLRVWFLAPLAGLSIVLGVVTIVLWQKSRKEYGLGSDTNSTMLLMGWRYTPTLLAVVYSQMMIMLFEDVTRTDPFSHLARPGGATAKMTILQRPREWWSVMINAYVKREGKRNWLVLYTCIVHLTALLAISPLSSALLTSEDVAVSKGVEFTRLAPHTSSALSLKPQGDTRFRTIGYLAQNVMTSPWISGSYAIFPAWSANVTSTPGKLPESGSWQTQTTIYQIDYSCENMTIKTLKNTTFMEATDLAPEYYQWRYQHPVILEMETANGCQYNLTLSEPVYTVQLPESLLRNGGVAWSSLKASNVSMPDTDSSINQSRSCRSDGDIVFMSTPWAFYAPEKTYPQVQGGFWNRDESTEISSRICSPNYYYAEISVTITSSPSENIQFDKSLFRKIRTLIPPALVNSSGIQEYSVDPGWSGYLYDTLLDVRNNVTLAGDYPALYEGAATILGSFYDYNLTTMIHQNGVAEQVKRIKERMFVELIQASMLQPGATKVESVPGTTMQVERRIVVVYEVAVLLAALFGLSSSLLIMIYWISRPSRMPLNLFEDPATTLGIARLISARHQTNLKFADLDRASTNDVASALVEERYVMSPGTLTSLRHNEKSSSVQSERTSVFSHDWRPTNLRLRSLTILLFFIFALIISLAVLYHFSQMSQLFRTIFVYQKTVHFLGVSRFAPFSIIPTVLGIFLGLWWDNLDKTLRRLQPYLSMSTQATPFEKGIALSYQSSYLAWASGKAVRNGHWMLFLVTMGSMACQALVIFLSALLDRQPDSLLQPIQISRTLEARQLPYLDTLFIPNTYEDGQSAAPRLVPNSLADLQTSWMYSAVLDLTIDAPYPIWSKDGWTFTPAVMPDLPDAANPSQIQHVGDDSSVSGNTTSSVHITLPTVGRRGRLECSPIANASDSSTWLRTWYIKSNSSDGTPQVSAPVYDLNELMFGEVFTSSLSRPKAPQCCLSTSEETKNEVNIGYWSINSPEPWRRGSGRFNGSWPLNITVKWIHGEGVPWPTNYTYGDIYGDGYRNFASELKTGLMFHAVPDIQALNCRPIIESAEASVTVDYLSGIVEDFDILGTPRAVDEPWSDPFVVRSEAGNTRWIFGVGNNQTYNITTSYGVLFLSALLGASDLEGIRKEDYNTNENLDDKTFNIRDTANGLNLDLMSYSMYKLAGESSRALLNATTLATLAQSTFQTFFQHYVGHSVDAEHPYGAYQSIGDTSLDSILSKKIDEYYQYMDWKPRTSYPKPNTDRVVNGTISTRIETLHINSTACWLSVAMLAWLFFTTLAIIGNQRSYLKPLIRNIDCIADVLVIVAGSEGLLKLLRERGSGSMKGEQISTRLGWFRTSDGKTRWGVEVIEDVGQGVVEWVDGPDDVNWERVEEEKKKRQKEETALKQTMSWLGEKFARFRTRSKDTE